MCIMFKLCNLPKKFSKFIVLFSVVAGVVVVLFLPYFPPVLFFFQQE